MFVVSTFPPSIVIFSMQNDAKEGFGILQYKNGERYEVLIEFYHFQFKVFSFSMVKGQWKNNFANGQGSLTYADGDKYIGEWKDGKKSGTGELFYVNGDKFRSKVYSQPSLILTNFFVQRKLAG